MTQDDTNRPVIDMACLLGDTVPAICSPVMLSGRAHKCPSEASSIRHSMIFEDICSGGGGGAEPGPRLLGARVAYTTSPD